MNCEMVHASLLEIVDGTLREPALADARAHLATCPSCHREVARHRAAWQLLGEEPDEPVPVERLRRMAAVALAQSRSGAAEPGRPLARVLPMRRRLARVAAAAAFLLAAAIGAEILWRGHGAPATSPPPDAVDKSATNCPTDPEFVKDFDVLRDLPDLDDSNDGGVLDVDHDQLVMLQLFEDA